jgi:hypothetical protein
VRFAIRPTVTLDDDRGTIVQPATNTRSRPLTDEVKAARIETARRAGWRQVAHTSLVPRGRWLVNAETDELLVHRGGTTFETGKASLLSGHGFDLVFTVGVDGDVLVLEKVTWPSSWSAYVRRQALRAAP